MQAQNDTMPLDALIANTVEAEKHFINGTGAFASDQRLPGQTTVMIEAMTTLVGAITRIQDALPLGEDGLARWEALTDEVGTVAAWVQAYQETEDANV